MRALDLKLFRDLKKLRGQVVAVGMVVASGVGVLVMALSVVQSLTVTADAYYERYNGRPSAWSTVSRKFRVSRPLKRE